MKPTTRQVALIVSKDSPHIWSGGLEGEALAKWLIGKANAILFDIQQANELAELKQKISQYEAAMDKVAKYSGIGVSLQASDPTHSPCKEAIEFDVAIGEALLARETLKCGKVVFQHPLGYSCLPELHEEAAESAQT